MPAKMQVMLAGPVSLRSRNVMRSLIRSKITKADFMKQIHKDNKSMYGSLVETSKEKAAREKRERKGRAPGQSGVEKAKEMDTEAHFLMNSKAREYYRFRVPGIRVPCSTKRILVLDDQGRIVKTKTARDPGTVPAVDEITKKTESGVLQAEEKPDPKVSALPSSVFIAQLVYFPYLNASKDLGGGPEDRRIISISPNEDKSKLSIPSVTRILNKTMSEQSRLNLELWKQRMIGELGVEGFQKYSQELLLNGKQFHSSIQNYLTQLPFDVPPAVENSWQSVQHVLKDVEEVKAIETHAVHSKLRYRGIVDCVAMYRGNLCVIDWKKSDKPKNSIENTFDAPIQVASYIGALNSDANYKFQIQSGVVVVGYTNGDPASVHEINRSSLNKYWKLWLKRLQQYYWELTTSKQDSTVENKK